MNIILASASPRRRELLEMLEVGFRIIPAENELSPEGLSPERTVMATAMGKAEDAAKRAGKNTLVIGADTLVYDGGAALGKPKNEEDAFNMLQRLSGREHQVYTGVALIHGDRRETRFEKTNVKFGELSDDEIRRYIATGEPMDKAGAYGAQGRGAVFIERIDGDFFNVMGLPLHLLSKMLKDFGVTLL